MSPRRPDQLIACTLLIALTTVATPDARSQPADSLRAESGRGFFKAGAMSLDLGAFNSAMRSAGYPESDDRVLTLGGGGYGGIHRWMFGGEGHGLVGRGQTTSDGAYRVSLNGGYGMFRMAYRAVERSALDIYPSLGLGGGGVQLEITGRSAPTFSEVLSDPGRSSRLSSGSFLVDLGISVDYRIRVPQARADAGGPLLGLSAGYVVAPWSSEWKLDGMNSVGGGPVVEIEGAYVRFSLGGWGSGQRRR